MRGVFTVTQKITAITGVQTLMHIQAGANRPLELYRVAIPNPKNNTNDQLEVSVARSTAASASGGTTISQGQFFCPRHVNAAGDLDVSEAVVRYGSGITAGATFFNLDYKAFSSLAGFVSTYMPEEFPTIPQDNGLLITMLGDAPSSELDLIVQVTWRE